MSKKLLIYGLAFGSAAAAMSYIYMQNYALRPSNKLQIIPLIGEFLIPLIAMTLFLRMVKKSNPEEFFIGKAIFLGFFLSIIISSSVSLFFSFMVQYNPDIINILIEQKLQNVRKGIAHEKLNAKEILELENGIRQTYTVSYQFKEELFLGASRGLFLSAIIALFLRAKSSKP